MANGLGYRFIAPVESCADNQDTELAKFVSERRQPSKPSGLTACHAGLLAPFGFLSDEGSMPKRTLNLRRIASLFSRFKT